MDERVWPEMKSECYEEAELWWGYADMKVGWFWELCIGKWEELVFNALIFGNQPETLWLINQELIGVGSSNLVARLGTWPDIHSNCSRSKGQKSRSQSHVTCQQTKTLYVVAVYGHINFKLGGNYRRGGRRVWYNFNVSRSNKPEVEIWWTIKILNAKINVKRRQIAEILHPNMKSGSANRTAVSKFTPEVVRST